MPSDFERVFLGRLLEARSRLSKRDRDFREAVAAKYVATPGDPRFCVRRLEVVREVARALGIQVLNNAVFSEVEAAACSLGFQAVKNGNRGLFRCAKRRDQDEDAALSTSRANRRDPRWSP
jgi:hypothetical protein